MNLGKSFHTTAQVIGFGSQTLMGPAADLFGWNPKVITFLHALVAFVQMTLALMAYNADPAAGKPFTPNDAGKLDSIKDIR